MSSWFSELSSNISDLSGTLNLKELTDKVQAAIPIDAETIQKLTLNSPDMVAEREQYKQDADRKARLKDSLAHMYPWETRDEEREILVDECKQAIMALSHDDATFFGPYVMPQLAVKTTDEQTEEDQNQDEDTEEFLEDDTEEDKPTESKTLQKDPSPESKENLAKLEPLPPLLGDFDLDAHVGLIQKMLQVDPKLVERQSILSGGGEREKTFWRNYFFHCAFTRYEAGLSIDEIWSDQPDTAQAAPASDNETVAIDKDEQSKSIVSQGAEAPASAQLSASGTAATVVAATATETSADDPEQTSTVSENAQTSAQSDDTPASSAGTSAEYEVISYEEDNFSGELDELEAEIAEALGN
mmetsp:Transcript_17261/g.24934  ORF Transcript_17261/g.24934 Transcript_17261/m.24934 type:complete len:357 (+) Transcript_17261:84-1154(+)|eukprot:CAMPEP_0202476196 /NCGR_PEP_ID=MMETSP1360-20130828/93298_1 /ASSEMBLY_ACC=CAM_ASM_000848 /TAXON_ID=515479 /ORGANISM="Licmophora paradoxa, Strain CCMP2313" /LENGTH=356 /DNA_ID=CAMNT_0049103395 /DNA_START=45 /DNA_END=1115 /DNA_ORIENTATION=+